MRDGKWRYKFTATSRGAASATVTLSGKGDPGYHFTAVGLAETALCLAGKTGAGKAEGGRCRGGGAGGVFSPGLAVNVSVFASRLVEIGLMEVTTGEGAVESAELAVPAELGVAPERHSRRSFIDLLVQRVKGSTAETWA